MLCDMTLLVRKCYFHMLLIALCSWHSVTYCFVFVPSLKLTKLPCICKLPFNCVLHIHGRHGFLVCPLIHPPTVPIPAVPLCRPGHRCLPHLRREAWFKTNDIQTHWKLFKILSRIPSFQIYHARLHLMFLCELQPQKCWILFASVLLLIIINYLSLYITINVTW